MTFNDTYLNKTPNKYARGRQGQFLEFVIWHETQSPNPENPHGTLRYNLRPDVKSSYHYLISHVGETFHYLNEVHWIAFGAGVETKVWDYQEWDVNVHSINVELDWYCNGTPVPEAELAAAVDLAIFFRNQFGIRLERKYHIGHDEAHQAHTPGGKRRTDPEGYSIDTVLERARLSPTIPFLNAPTIGFSIFNRVLTSRNSPAAPEAEALYEICLKWGIDPAVALAMFGHESKFGTLGVAARHNTKNWGNVRRPYDRTRAIGTTPENFAVYPSWQLGLEDWCQRIKELYGAKWGLDTVHLAIHRYAPVSDGNSPHNYIRAIEKSVYTWQAEARGNGVDLPGGVDPRFKMTWEKSGGVWQPNELTPGLPLAPAFKKGEHWYQTFERGIARLHEDGTTSWLLDSEKAALLASD